MSYEDPFVPVDPPEIRHIQGRLSQHEFYVSLAGRPDVAAFELITEWMKKQPPHNPVAVLFNYMPETDVEPGMLQACLILDAPVDVG